jgi:hypothetical protein
MLGSVDSLQNEIQRRYLDAQSKRKLVDSLLRSADDHERAGNETQAKLDRESAARYERDAEDAEKQAGIYEAEVLVRMQRAANIDREIEQTNHQFKAKLDELENKKKSLLG